MSNLSEQERCIAETTKGDKIIFITSITRPFRDHAHSRAWRNTIWQSAAKYPLWVYNENTWEMAHARAPLTSEDLPYVSCMFDVFQVAPLTPELHARIDEFYKVHGTPGLNERIMDGKVLVRKVAAMQHALQVVPDGTTVIWLDVDVVFSSQKNGVLAKEFLDFVQSRDVSYLAETICWREARRVESFQALPERCLDFRVDTGIVAFRANALTRRFTSWWLEAYSGKTLALARTCLEKAVGEENVVSFFTGPCARHYESVKTMQDLCELGYIRSSLGLNDIHTFALALHAFGSEVQHGWLAYKTRGCGEVEDVNSLPGGHCHPCKRIGGGGAGEEGLVSSFCACDYLVHVKGGSAIMARQHTARAEKDIRDVKTTDAELLLPPEYFPVTSHIDHRMACGDKRGKYGKIWSLNQMG